MVNETGCAIKETILLLGIIRPISSWRRNIGKINVTVRVRVSVSVSARARIRAKSFLETNLTNPRIT